MVSLPKHWANVVLTYSVRGEDGLSELADRLEEVARQRPGGKFGKREAAYLPQSPFPPTLWRPSCGRCRFWEEGEPGEPGHCHVVGRDGDRFGGEAIHYRGWCGLWMPAAGEPPFAWFRERLRPDGKSSVRGEYDPRTTAKRRRRTASVERSADAADRRGDADARQGETGARGNAGGRQGETGARGNAGSREDTDAREEAIRGDEEATDDG